MPHKYTNYSNPKPQPVEPEVEETVVEPETEDAREAESEPLEETAVVDTIGIVVDCKKLRVRKLPNAISETLCEIPASSTVKIDLEKSTVGFYKVCTEAGIEGYCMKQYIAVV